MLRSIGLLLLSAPLFAQTFVRYTSPAATASSISATVENVNFVMPCGAASYTTYTGSFLNCVASYPANSTFAAKLNGAADWRKFVGRNGNEFTLSKKVAAHRISDVTILPSSSQPGGEALTLGYYPLPPLEFEDFDLASPNLTQDAYGTPRSVFTITHYVNCAPSGVLVSNCGESVTVPVSNLIKQPYYVGVSTLGDTNGTFRVHLSDSSVADYVYTTLATDGIANNASSANQVEKFFTLQMQAGSAGVTATISFTAASLNSGASSLVGIVAVGMGGQTSGAVDPRTLPQEFYVGLGPDIYGAQEEAPRFSSIPTSGVSTVALTHVDTATDSSALQAALDDAMAAHGRWDILLGDGFDARSLEFHNPAGRDDNWIVIRPVTPPTKAAGGSVAIGERVHPSDTFHARILGNSGGGNAVTAYTPAHHIALVNLELSHSAPQGAAMYQVIGFSNPGPNSSYYPHHLIIQGSYVHGIIPSDGIPRENTGLSIHGVAADASYLGIYDSHFSWFVNGGGQEGEALFWNQTEGIITLENNSIEASDESLICCVIPPQTNVRTFVKNVTLRHNYSTKNRAGIGLMSQKNHFEFKSVAGLTVEDNVFENSWSANQFGQCIALNSHFGQYTVDWNTGIANVIIRRNFCHAGAGMTINLQEELQGTPVADTQMSIGQYIKIENNLIWMDGVQAGAGQPGSHFGFNRFLPASHFIFDHNSLVVNPADDAAGIVDYGFGGKAGYPDTRDLPRLSTVYVTNNDMGRLLQGGGTSAYQLFPGGINATNNIIGRSGDGFLGAANGSAQQLEGTSWYWAMRPIANGGLGNPKKVIGMETNYLEGCLLSSYLADHATCTPPPTLTYPNPVIGADKPAILSKYCEIKTGNRADIPCTVPTLP